MKLINVTNTHRGLVKGQLDNTDAELVEVYTAGNTTVIYTKAPKHHEIVIVNNRRALRNAEVATIKGFFFKKIGIRESEVSCQTINEPKLVEISVPIN